MHLDRLCPGHHIFNDVHTAITSPGGNHGNIDRTTHVGHRLQLGIFEGRTRRDTDTVSEAKNRLSRLHIDRHRSNAHQGNHRIGSCSLKHLGDVQKRPIG